MLTIFSTCKPFESEFAIIQTNAITSWVKSGKDIEIILLGNEQGTKHIADKLNLKYIEKIKRNDMGTPYISDLFNIIKAYGKYDILCYVNADIIFVEGLLQTVEFVREKFNKFLIVGRRWNVDIKAPIDFSDKNWRTNLKEYKKKNGLLYQSGAIDYFIFTKNLYQNIPQLLVGRSGWDNYLLGNAILKTLFVFDATETIFAVHQNHSYNHHKEGKFGVWKGIEAEHNRKLLHKLYLHISLGNIKKTFFKLKKKGNHYKILPNLHGLIKGVFSYIKGIGVK